MDAMGVAAVHGHALRIRAQSVPPYRDWDSDSRSESATLAATLARQLLELHLPRVPICYPILPPVPPKAHSSAVSAPQAIHRRATLQRAWRGHVTSLGR